MKKYYLNVREPIINHKHKIVGYKNLRIYVEKEVYLEWYRCKNKEKYHYKINHCVSLDAFASHDCINDPSLIEEDIAVQWELRENQKELAQKVIQAIHQLSPIQKKRFILHIIQGVSVREIAQKESKQESTIYKSIQRARGSIMNYLRTNN